MTYPKSVATSFQSKILFVLNVVVKKGYRSAIGRALAAASMKRRVVNYAARQARNLLKRRETRLRGTSAQKCRLVIGFKQ